MKIWKKKNLKKFSHILLIFSFLLFSYITYSTENQVINYNENINDIEKELTRIGEEADRAKMTEIQSRIYLSELTLLNQFPETSQRNQLIEKLKIRILDTEVANIKHFYYMAEGKEPPRELSDYWNSFEYDDEDINELQDEKLSWAEKGSEKSSELVKERDGLKTSRNRSVAWRQRWAWLAILTGMIGLILLNLYLEEK